MTIRRRTVLAGGLVGAVVLAFGGVGVALQPGQLRAARGTLQVLDARSFSVLAAVADRVCPGGGGLPSAWDLEVPEKVDTVLDRLDPASAAELRQVLLLLESGLAGLVLDGRIRPFTQCGAEAQDQVLEAWRTSRWMIRRSAYKALVSAVSAAYWADRRTWAHLGYAGPPRFSA